MKNRCLIFKISITGCAWKAANSRGRTLKDITSSMSFMFVGRKRTGRKRVTELRELDQIQVLKEKIRTVEPHRQSQIQQRGESNVQHTNSLQSTVLSAINLPCSEYQLPVAIRK